MADGKIVRCSVVFPDCQAVVEGETEDDVMESARRHAKQEHGVEELDDERQAALLAGIRQG